jgi:uncharacterized protein
MKLHLDAPGATYVVRSYAPGLLRVGEMTFRSSTIVSATTVAPWRPASVEELSMADLEPLFVLAPEVVLLGTGEQQRFPEATLLVALATRRIGIEVMDTRAACRTYNVLVSESRPVVAALML